MFKEPNWELPAHDSFYLGFKNRGELYSMTLPDWEIANKYLDQKRACLDIGGHIGTTVLRYANNFERVHTFEPLYHSLIEKNLSHVSNIDIYPYAASDANEHLTMITRKGNTGLSMILTDENRHYKHRSGYDPREIKMETRIIDEYEFTDIDFVKIDTEGFVLRPLKGMLNTLEQNDWPLLQIEFNNLNQNPNECFKLLKKLKYKEIDKFHVDHFFIRD